MDLKSCFLTLFLLLLLATPRFSLGGESTSTDSDVYEIDYRGPETHSSIPPPDHSRGKPMLRRERAVALPKSKGLRSGGGGNRASNEKKIHG